MTPQNKGKRKRRRGHKENNPETSKQDELLHRLTLQKEFQDLVRGIRSVHGIPEKGFSGYEEESA